MKVTNETVVSIRYKIANSQGEILEDILKEEPIAYLHGIGQILPVLEENLVGLKSGDKVFFTSRNHKVILE